MGKLSVFWEKLKSLKHPEIILCALLLAVVLTVYFACVSCAGGKTGTTPTVVSPGGGTGTSNDYCHLMQSRVESVVSEIEGVGKASVVINWDKSAAGGSLQTQTQNPQATGALIVCEGGNSAKVKIDVMYAVSTLLNLSIDKIIVYPKSK